MSDMDLEGLDDDTEWMAAVAQGKTWAAKLNHEFTWTDRQDTRHLITTMDLAHRQNVLRFLRARAELIKTTVEIAADYTILKVPFPGDPDETDATQWLYTTPLYRALVRAGVNDPTMVSVTERIADGS